MGCQGRVDRLVEYSFRRTAVLNITGRLLFAVFNWVGFVTVKPL